MFLKLPFLYSQLKHNLTRPLYGYASSIFLKIVPPLEVRNTFLTISPLTIYPNTSNHIPLWDPAGHEARPHPWRAARSLLRMTTGILSPWPNIWSFRANVVALLARSALSDDTALTSWESLGCIGVSTTLPSLHFFPLSHLLVRLVGAQPLAPEEELRALASHLVYTLKKRKICWRHILSLATPWL